MGFWSRSSAQAALSQEYQESVAHRVRDILTGVDHSAHNNRRDKNAIKALQRPEALAGVIEILKAMPEPECHINIDDDSDDDESRNHHQDLGGASANDVSSPVSGLAKNTTRPKATTVVAATTIAAAAATSAVAATLAVTIRKNKNKDARDTTDSTKPNGEIQMLDEDAETTTTAITKNTVVRFRPAVDTVSSCA